MTGTLIKCDQCGDEIKEYIGTKKLFPSHWITLSRSNLLAGDQIPVGVYHFCCDNCMVKWSEEQKDNKI